VATARYGPHSSACLKYDLTKYRLAMHSAHGNLPYSLDILHADRMVFLVEWDDAGNVEIILFRRGDWESKLLGAMG
jgi:hypothetical protein